MQLLCFGDVAIVDPRLSGLAWMPPAGATPGDQVRLLFNWELPVGDTLNPMPRSRGSRFLASPDSPGVIRNWSPGFATLATNHILDAGQEGLVRTIQTLHRIGFSTTGAGRSRPEIVQPAYWETSEGRLVIVNWVFPETHPDWMSEPGPNCWPGLAEATDTVQSLKRQFDWVMIVPHWSDEHFSYPRPEDREIARQLAGAGADLVIGHHPHVVRGMEIIGSCPVFYSLGNFYFSDIPNHHGGWAVRQAPRNREGLGVRISFRQDRQPELQVLSFWQASGRVITDPLGRAARRMQRVSLPLQGFPESSYAKWYADRRARFDRLGYRWHFRVWQLGLRGHMRYLFRLVHFHSR
jgi:hypothetical protein